MTFIKNTPGAVSTAASRSVPFEELSPSPFAAICDTLVRYNAAHEVPLVQEEPRV